MLPRLGIETVPPVLAAQSRSHWATTEVHEGLVARSCLTLLRPHRLKPSRLLRPRDAPGKNSGVGCQALLQGIVPTQGLNPFLRDWQEDSSPSESAGKPVIYPQKDFWRSINTQCLINHKNWWRKTLLAIRGLRLYFRICRSWNETVETHLSAGQE